MLTTFLLQSSPSILSETNYNLWILWEFIFQINQILSLIRILILRHSSQHLYKLGCTSPTHLHANLTSKPNPSHHPSSTTILATLSPPPPLFQTPPSKLNPVPVVRSQKPKQRKKNQVKTQFVSSVIYRQNLAIISRRCYDFFGEFEVNPTSLVSSTYRTLAPGLYGSEIKGL
jgi:hypothetical protein